MSEESMYAGTLEQAYEEMSWAAVVVEVESNTQERKFIGFESLQEYMRWARQFSSES